MRVILCLAMMLGTSLAQQPSAGPAHVAKPLEDNDFTTFRSIVKASGAYDGLENPAVKFTVLAPSNDAVNSFLNSMGMTLDELMQQGELIKEIVAYHTLVGFSLHKKDILSIQARFNGSVPVYTLARPWHVTVMEKGGQAMIRDAQGNIAHHIRTLNNNNHTVHVIDKVLFSGNYFTTLESLFRNFPSYTSATARALKKAGLSALVSQKGFADTLFLADNKAMAKIEAKLAGQHLAEQEIKSLVEFHMVKGRHVIPEGFKNGQLIMTMLPGQSIAVDTSAGPSHDFVTDARGQKVEITKANLFVGKGVAHSIASVLQPAEKAQPAASTTAAATTTAAKTSQTATASSKFSITDLITRIFSHKAAVVGPMFGQKPGATVVVDASKTSANDRKLLQAAAPGWADPNIQAEEKHLGSDSTDMGEAEDADNAIVADEDPNSADPSTPGFANPQIDTGKSISEANSDTKNQENAEDQIAAFEDPTQFDPSLPAWAQPTLSFGRSIGDASSSRNEADSENAIANTVASYDSGACC